LLITLPRHCWPSLTFIIRHLNSVFVLRGWNFLRDSPLNRASLTINVHKVWTECDIIIQ
jgi:hypothetical protein